MLDLHVNVDVAPIGGYSREQCEADAIESGLEAEALYAQVSDLQRMADGTLDTMLRAHGVATPLAFLPGTVDRMAYWIKEEDG